VSDIVHKILLSESISTHLVSQAGYGPVRKIRQISSGLNYGGFTQIYRRIIYRLETPSLISSHHWRTYCKCQSVHL